ncbi:aldo/keto reductase [Rhizobium sp. LjRoot98]|uniref:aldo/keto reductase n=1 Tax=unclassified Rhizobium TaxID=2613769 RepID=UPI0007157D61|nr:MULTISPECIES: aldo/keto reductase [unclassified Rhizobium]KQV29244.1 oxidoreductase [Rhizobium sp. Root1204]KQY03759.1 oxidoreductase [Rhizobium sp. Root1334]KRC00398.1 oxidoreductase [Rhizobium sp. Root73]
MSFRIKLHRDGPEFSRMVWGAFRIAGNPETSGIASIARTVDTCLDAGITTIDHADIYGGYRVEAMFGAMLATRPDLRNRIELVTKCGIALTGPARPEHRVKHYNSTAGHIRLSLENSLRNLKTDHVDLLLLHRPDPLLDAAEVAGVLEALVKEGKTRAVGVSNYTPSQVALLQAKLNIPLVANQIELSVSHTAPLTDGTLDDCQRLGISPMAWSPLGGGRLFDREKGNPRLVDLLTALAAQYGVSGPGTVALAWLLRLPSKPLPIIGSTDPERVKALARAVEIEFDLQDWFQVLEVASGRPVA